MADTSTTISIIGTIVGVGGLSIALVTLVVSQWRASGANAEKQAKLDAEQTSDLKAMKYSTEGAWKQIHEICAWQRKATTDIAEMSKQLALLQQSIEHQKSDIGHMVSANEQILEAITAVYNNK